MALFLSAPRPRFSQSYFSLLTKRALLFILHLVESSTFLGGTMNLTNELLRQLGTINRAIHSLMDMKFQSYGLKRGQFIFLTRICETPGICQTDLTELVSVDKGTTAKAVKKLEDASLISRQKIKTDKRMWHLYPTDIGKKLYEKLIEEENRQIAVGLAGFSQEEVRTLLDLMQKLRTNIQIDWKNHE